MDEAMRLQAIIDNPRTGYDARYQASNALRVLGLRQELNRSSPTAASQAADLNSQLADARHRLERVSNSLTRLDAVYRLLAAGIPAQVADSYDIFAVDPITKKDADPKFTVGEDGVYGSRTATKEQAKDYIAENLRKLQIIRTSVRDYGSGLRTGIVGLEAKITNLGFKPDPNYGAPGNPSPAEAAYQGRSTLTRTFNSYTPPPRGQESSGFVPALIPTVEAEDLQSLEEGDTTSVVPLINRGSKNAKAKVANAIKNAQPAVSNKLASPKPPKKAPKKPLKKPKGRR